MSRKLEIKWVKEHSDDCVAISLVDRKKWNSPWAYPDITWADKRGRVRKNGGNSHMWLRVICNDPSCTAEIWVHNESLMSMLPYKKRKPNVKKN